MSKYDDRTAAAIERQLARRHRSRQLDRAWAAERQRVMGYVAFSSTMKTTTAADLEDIFDNDTKEQ